MTLNLFGILWTTAVINVYSQPFIGFKAPAKLVRFLEKITMTKLHYEKLSTKYDGKEGDGSATPSSEAGAEQKETLRNSISLRESATHRQPVNRVASMEGKNLNETVNYSTEWRFLTRAIDKVLFVLNVLLLTASVMCIILVNC